VQVLESKMMEIEHDIAALHAHEKMSRNAVADGEAVLHAEAVEQAEEEAAHEATEADESLLNKQVCLSLSAFWMCSCLEWVRCFCWGDTIQTRSHANIKSYMRRCKQTNKNANMEIDIHVYTYIHLVQVYIYTCT